MNGVSRFLSRRDKNSEKRSLKHPLGKSRHAPPSVSPELYRVFTNDEKPTDKDAEKRKTLLQRLHVAGITSMKDEQVNYALSWSPDDLDEAYNLLVLANESLEGELKVFNTDVKMHGAVNRNMVTCYLDSLLFAMFARMDSFEAMLYDEFNDEPRKKLAAILRLWVNFLRTGRLIRVDFTKRLQDALAQCGWEEAAEVRQQDASEAFTFITGALELPLLTLKMDIYHTGREDREDDHKFVNERLLEVAIPEEEGTDRDVTLEDCLENYFNNRIEVKRYLQRQNTVSSVQSTNWDSEKQETMHIETVELAGPETPLVATPTTFGPPSPISPARPLSGRRRGDSIFTERYTMKDSKDQGRFDEKKHLEEMLDRSSSGRPRSASLLRKEVMMPAWQFFSLIPWYTDNVPKTDAQVAAHFSSKRPVLGICLKRYTMLPNGTKKRLNTYVDIPLEIGLPHFISDEHMQDEGPLFGNFKLVLQSVVCHRGFSVDSGHYVSLVRANKPPSQTRPGTSHTDKEDEDDSWLRFDDISNPRIQDVDIQQALREESPYLLFYQVQPIDEELANRGDPPSYDEAQSVAIPVAPSKETLGSETDATATDTDIGEWEKISSAEAPPSVVGSITDSEAPGRTSMSSNRRSSVVIEDLENSASNISRGRLPPTPDETRTGFLSASRRNSKAWLSGNKSRPSSESGENRLSLTLSRLTGRGSKDKLVSSDNGSEDPVIIVNEVPLSTESTQTIKPLPQPPASPGKLHKDTGVSRSKSKKHFRSKSREPSTDGAATKGKNKAKDRPERECVVM